MKLFNKKFQADPLAEAGAEKKDWKRSKAFIGGITALVVIIGANFGSAFVGNFFGKEHARALQAEMMKLEVKDSDWKTITEIPGFSIEVPVALNKTPQTIPPELSGLIASGISYEYSSTPFSAVLGYINLVPGRGSTYYLDPVINTVFNNMVKSMRGFSKVEVVSRHIDTLNIPGVQSRALMSDYKLDGLKCQTRINLYLKEDDIYQVVISYADNETNRKIAGRIIRSVKIKSNK